MDPEPGPLVGGTDPGSGSGSAPKCHGSPTLVAIILEAFVKLPLADRLIGGEEGSHPSQLRLFKNRPNMTFDDAAGKPDQEFTLGRRSSKHTVPYFSNNKNSNCHWEGDFHWQNIFAMAQ